MQLFWVKLDFENRERSFLRDPPENSLKRKRLITLLLVLIPVIAAVVAFSVSGSSPGGVSPGRISGQILNIDIPSLDLYEEAVSNGLIAGSGTRDFGRRTLSVC